MMPLNSSISPSARRTIREAFEALESTVSPLEARDFNNTTLEDVHKAALAIENSLGGERRSLRNMRRLMPLFNGLQHYSQCIEVLCNGTPYLPWIWAPIKLVIQVASDYVAAFERIIHAYSRIAEALPRFDILHKAFAKNLDFQETLAIFYSDILRFHREAYVFVRRNGWKLLFLTSWGRFQNRFDNIISDLKAHEDLVDKTANAVDIAEAKRERKLLQDARAEKLSRLANKEQEEHARKCQAITAWLKVDDGDQQVVLDLISTEAHKHPGTCSWILKQPSLVSWLNKTPDMPLIWLEGNPGTGKSVMATQIEAFLRTDGERLVVRHFCTYQYTSSVQYDKVLRSLLLQMIRFSGDLVAHVYEEYVLAQKTATVQVLDQLVLVIAGSIGSVPAKPTYVYVVLDGLDECEPEKQGRVANLLERLAAASSSADPSRSTVCKVLVTSRRSPVLAKRFRNKPHVSLAAEKKSIENAIRMYSDKRLGFLRPRFAQIGLTHSDLSDISKSIVEKADGMFLWSRLVLDYLSSNFFYSHDEVKLAVETLPKELSKFYAKILSEITARLDARSAGRMRSILSWIAFARRPLRKMECRSALVFSEGSADAADLPPPYIFDMCTPLIQENKDTTFSFIHVSVKEYLQQIHESTMVLQEADAIQKHGLALMKCLLSSFNVFDPQHDRNKRELRVLKGLHGFHMYATEYWVDYLLAAARPGYGLDMTSALYRSASELAQRLTRTDRPTMAPAQGGLRTLDPRLENLRHHGQLYHVVQAALRERSLRTKDVQPTTPSASAETAAIEETAETAEPTARPQDLKALLASYQFCIRSLLPLPSYPGVSAEHFEQFKREFRTSAFTCRFNHCPRATAGFQDEKKLVEHELSHTQRIRCKIPGCPNPPFSSSRALKNHMDKYHPELTPAKKGIGIRAAAPPSTTSVEPPSNSSGNARHRPVQQAQNQDQPRVAASSSTSSEPMLRPNRGANEWDATLTPVEFPIDFGNGLASGHMMEDFDFEAFLHDNDESNTFGLDATFKNFEGNGEIGTSE